MSVRHVCVGSSLSWSVREIILTAAISCRIYAALIADENYPCCRPYCNDPRGHYNTRPTTLAVVFDDLSEKPSSMFLRQESNRLGRLNAVVPPVRHNCRPNRVRLVVEHEVGWRRYSLGCLAPREYATCGLLPIGQQRGRKAATAAGRRRQPASPP